MNAGHTFSLLEMLQFGLGISAEETMSDDAGNVAVRLLQFGLGISAEETKAEMTKADAAKLVLQFGLGISAEETAPM